MDPETLQAAVDAAAAQWPDRPALVTGDDAVSFNDLVARSNQVCGFPSRGNRSTLYFACKNLEPGVVFFPPRIPPSASAPTGEKLPYLKKKTQNLSEFKETLPPFEDKIWQHNVKIELSFPFPVEPLKYYTLKF